MPTLYIILGIAGVIMLIYYARSKKPISSALKGMATGGLGLVLIHLFGGVLSLPLSLFNLAWSLILGLPGVVLAVLLKFIVV